jgi:GAF domain-containing protein
MIGETSDRFSAFALERERTPLDTWVDAMVTSLVDSGWAAARIELFVAGIAVRSEAGDVQRLVSEVIIVPLVVRDEHLGALTVVATNPDPVAIRMLYTFAEVFTRAVDMERRMLRVESEAARSAVIARIGESIRRSLDREEILQAVARDVRAAFGCASCAMYLRDNRSPAMARIIAAEDTVAVPGAHPTHIPIDGTLLEGCFGRGGTVRIESTVAPLDAERLAPFHAEAMLMVPFVVDGRIDAAIAVQYARPHVFEDSDLPLMRSIAMQVGLALANSRLYERERAARRRAEDIERNVRVLKNTRSVPQILHLLLNMIAQEFSLAGSAWELTARDLVCRVIVPREDGSGPTVGATANPVLAILENKSEQDVIAISTRGESAWIPVIGKRGGFALPLRIENRLFGMLAFDGMSRSADEREDRDAYLRTVAAHGALALANARAFEAEHRFAAESAAISEAGRTILAHNELEPLALAMAQYALDLSGSATVCLYLARAGALQRIGCAAPGGVCQFPSTLALNDPPATRGHRRAAGRRLCVRARRLRGAHVRRR